MVLKCALKILESGSIRAIRPLEPGGGGGRYLASSVNRILYQQSQNIH